MRNRRRSRHQRVRRHGEDEAAARSRDHGGQEGLRDAQVPQHVDVELPADVALDVGVENAAGRGGHGVVVHGVRDADVADDGGGERGDGGRGADVAGVRVDGVAGCGEGGGGGGETRGVDVDEDEGRAAAGVGVRHAAAEAAGGAGEEDELVFETHWDCCGLFKNGIQREKECTKGSGAF